MKTSTDPRHLARRLALQVLFAWESGAKSGQMAASEDASYEYARKLYQNRVRQEEKFDHSLAQLVIKRVVRKSVKIDKYIAEAAPEWPLKQIAPIDLTILRIAVAELTREKDLPYKVVIDEAVELAKEFGSENSRRFINGVLGTVVERLGVV